MRILLAAVLAALPLLSETKVLRNFTLIDGTGKPPVASAAMILTDGRITWVGTAAQLKAPAGAETLDLAGKYVTPGLINLHGHLGNVVDLTLDPKNYTLANVEKSLKTYASYGVTAVASMGTEQDLIYDFRAKQRSGRPSMTRVFTAGRGFTGENGYPTAVPGMKGIPYEVKTPAEAAKYIDELAAKKVDVVKVWVDDHLGRERKISIDLSRAIIENAHKKGLPVAAHLFYLSDAKQLVDAGLDAFMHSVRDAPVDQALIDAMKKRGVWQAAPTLSRELSMFAYAKPPEWLKEPFFTRSISPKVIETMSSDAYTKRVASAPDFSKYPAFLETAKKNLKKLADSGVKYGFGTDAGGAPARFPGVFEHMEMELMVDAGLTPMQVITAATRSSAEFLKAKDLGTLKKGKWADLVVLGRNPLENIQNMRSLETVYIAGNKAN